jgi:hypothetical protein
VKTIRILAALALLALMFATAQGTEASPKLHFLKSKKFWTAALAVTVPGTISGVLATQNSQGVITPRRPPGTTQPRK